MTQLPDTRYTLLARLADPRDVAAWSEFTQIYEEAIYRYSRSRGLQDSDAWEVVQQVLLVVHHAVGDWRPSGRAGSFRGWLHRTARRVCLRCLRDRRRADRALGGSSVVERLHGIAGPAPSERALELDRRRWAFCWAAGEIEREVEAKTWRAFWLTSVEGVAAAQAADELGMKVGTVYAAKCRVLARVRQRVREICEKNP
ncbi:MAG TPA: sigma-70 family RNA polymerase sigma factor [Pirellulales bacterium]|nr:sigma-70 family RNA polymerase sigma factor [Pirellulales bacterium]